MEQVSFKYSRFTYHPEQGCSSTLSEVPFLSFYLGGRSTTVLFYPLLFGLVQTSWACIMPTYQVKPLPLARIFKDTGFRSDAALFRLPLEILQLIVDYLDFSLCDYDDNLDRQYEVPEFALTSFDCYVIARSKQFASLQIQFDRFSVYLIKLLQRDSSSLGQRSLSIGRFVRSIVFELDHLGSVLFPFAEEIRDKAMRKLSAISGVEFDQFKRCADIKPAVGTLMGILCPLLEQCCPNLVLFDWKANLTLMMPSVLWFTLPGLPLKYLILRDSLVQLESRGQDANGHPQGLFNEPCARVTCLSIHCRRKMPLSASTLKHNACFPILDACSASLTWLDIKSEDSSLAAATLYPHTRFPNLRTLKLSFAATMLSVDTLEAFFPVDSEEGVKSLEIHICTDDPWKLRREPEDSAVCRFFSRRGCIPSLTSMRLRYDNVNTAVAMLSANRQLQHLELTTSWIQRDQSERHLACFPVLATFTHLTFLNVHLQGHVSLDVFDALGNIMTLEHLRAGAREPIEDARLHDMYWKADPARILHSLRRLDRLKTLAFWRDGYEQHPRLPWEDYYYYRFSDAQVARLVNGDIDWHVIENVTSRSRVSSDMIWLRSPKYIVVVAGVPFRPPEIEGDPADDGRGLSDESSSWMQEHATRMAALAEVYFAQHRFLQALEVGGRTFVRENGAEAPVLLGRRWGEEWAKFDPLPAKFAMPALGEVMVYT